MRVSARLAVRVGSTLPEDRRGALRSAWTIVGPRDRGRAGGAAGPRPLRPPSRSGTWSSASSTRTPTASPCARVDVGEGEPRADRVRRAQCRRPARSVAVALHRCGACRTALKIKRSKIRGVVSNGMICSEARARDSGDEHEGILVLDTERRRRSASRSRTCPERRHGDGARRSSITPNRGDWVFDARAWPARCARTSGGRADRAGSCACPDCRARRGRHRSASRTTCRSTSRTPDGCHALLRRGWCAACGWGPSPDWLVAEASRPAGLRAVNNVVDVTNLVHAGARPAAARVRPGDKRARRGRHRARGGAPRRARSYETLDGAGPRARSAEDVVIADTEGRHRAGQA